MTNSDNVDALVIPGGVPVVVELKEARQTDFSMASVRGRIVAESVTGIMMQVEYNGGLQDFMIPWSNIMYVKVIKQESEEDDEG